ncbi:type VI secretion system baseplate subunit TssG [Chitinimonas lacunae]|uniref:Type VI secretion system baseplate subunit TssG n=1 Tax=Chitinimonas lacunae TaxID=1963018 RepID=A0ABV8MXN7_9NEIS
MAGADRYSPGVLALWQAVEEAPYRHQLFAVLRQIECLHPEMPRLGRASRPSAEPVRLGQMPALDFAPAELARLVWQDRTPPRLEVRSFGLFGPAGAMPIHLSEYAWDRLHNNRDETLARFADVFHHRMLLLFYRAWADAQPTVSHDRPDDDRFARFVGGLCGYGFKTLLGRDAVPDVTKLFHAGLLSRQVRNADGLRQLLFNYFRVPVSVEQFHFRWLTVPAEQRTSLGARNSAAQLGVGTLAGSRVPDRQSSFRIVLGPLDFHEYQRFLPGSPSVTQLRDWVRNYLGYEFTWDVQLILKKEAVPPCQLGGAQLGRTGWIGREPRQRDADDMVLEPETA